MCSDKVRSVRLIRWPDFLDHATKEPGSNLEYTEPFDIKWALVELDLAKVDCAVETFQSMFPKYPTGKAWLDRFFVAAKAVLLKLDPDGKGLYIEYE